MPLSLRTCLLSTTRPNLLTTRYMSRILSIHHVICSLHHPSSFKFSRGWPHGSVLLLFKCFTTFQPQFRLSNFTPNPQDHRFPPRKEFNVLRFENLSVHEKLNGIPTVSLPRLPTKCHIHPLHLQIVSRGNTHLPPIRIQKKTNQGFWRSEVHVRRLLHIFLYVSFA